jgi:SAM-dependent methyltransferase
MWANYHHNPEKVAQILKNAHNPNVSKIRKEFFDAEFSFFHNHIQNQNVLVAGSGLGHDSFILAEYNKYVTGIELVQLFVDGANEELNKTNQTNISFIQWDFFNLDYPDNFFDIAVLNMWTIWNFDDKESVIRSLKKVTKKLFFWFWEPVEEDVKLRLQMYKDEDMELVRGLYKNEVWEFEIDWTTIRERISWMESNCTSREEILAISQKMWVRVDFYPIFKSFVMAEVR